MKLFSCIYYIICISYYMYIIYHTSIILSYYMYGIILYVNNNYMYISYYIICVSYYRNFIYHMMNGPVG